MAFLVSHAPAQWVRLWMALCDLWTRLQCAQGYGRWWSYTTQKTAVTWHVDSNLLASGFQKLCERDWQFLPTWDSALYAAELSSVFVPGDSVYLRFFALCLYIDRGQTDAEFNNQLCCVVISKILIHAGLGQCFFHEVAVLKDDRSCMLLILCGMQQFGCVHT